MSIFMGELEDVPLTIAITDQIFPRIILVKQRCAIGISDFCDHSIHIEPERHTYSQCIGLMDQTVILIAEGQGQSPISLRETYNASQSVIRVVRLCGIPMKD